MKYGNRKVVAEDGTFDSEREYRRWRELKLLLRAGKITNLRRQVRFNLIPNQYRDGKLIERKVDYVADFVYADQYGASVVEDAKGVRTDVYKIKKKLMLEKYSIVIQEV